MGDYGRLRREQKRLFLLWNVSDRVSAAAADEHDRIQTGNEKRFSALPALLIRAYGEKTALMSYSVQSSALNRSINYRFC